jgi:cell fate regulator YaaT (PSP1 superfamily)
MGCGSCSTGGCTPGGCKSNGSCLTDGGCSKLDVYDWLSDMDLPSNYKPFHYVEIRFKGSRKDFYRNEENIYLEAGELVAVETITGGYDIGHVTLTGELVRMQMNRKRVTEEKAPLKIYRKATTQDVDKWKQAKERESETMHKARTIALELGLAMKLSDVEYQGDKAKATFFYTAEGRVDFRELIKKLAESFKVRIEMRQIGMRQEASRLGGIGSCGRELCCSTWLTDFKTVSTAAARYQNLSLNTLKLAGQCGKLKCCLNYELDTYMDALKTIPNNADRLKTEKGDARLQKTDIFKQIMWYTYAGEENTWIPLEVARVKEIQEMNKNNQKPEDLRDFSSIEEETEIPVKAFDYENVVGQDSLTRLDDKAKKRHNNNRNKARKRPEGGKVNPNQVQANQRPLAPNDPNAPRPNPNRNRNKHRRNNPNRKPEQE